VTPGFSLASLDVWNWPDAYRSLGRAEERAAALEGFQDRMRDRYRAKRALGAELAAGHLTLSEAVQRFRLLVSDPADFWRVLRTIEPGSSDEERLWRHVMDWADIAVEHDPEHRAALLARLESELQRHLAQPGGRSQPT
jgi:hypothetical protein